MILFLDLNLFGTAPQTQALNQNYQVYMCLKKMVVWFLFPLTHFVWQRKKLTSKILLMLTFFSAKRNESVETKTKPPSSLNTYTLDSSGLMLEFEALYQTDLNPEIRS